jgi:hypothetical protein
MIIFFVVGGVKPSKFRFRQVYVASVRDNIGITSLERGVFYVYMTKVLPCLPHQNLKMSWLWRIKKFIFFQKVHSVLEIIG